MKKGKPKPYVKKESKKDRFMIYLVAGVMVLSGLYFSGIQNTNTGGQNGQVSVRSYNIEQVADNTYAFITGERQEIAVIPGERAAAGLNRDTMGELANTTTGTVYKVEVEEALNSYILFRFYAADANKAVFGLKTLLDKTLGDYRMYRVYSGIQPSETSESVSMELLSQANTSLTSGSLVKIILLREKNPEEAGNDTGELFGFVKNVVPSGPVVKARVNSIDGLAVWGLTAIKQDVYELNRSVGGLEAASQPPYILANGLVDEPGFNLTGVKLTLQGNYTIIEFENASLGEEIAGLLKGLGLNHTLVEGSVTLSLPVDANLSRVREMLAGMNINNLTVHKLGRVMLPEEVIIDNVLVPVKNNKNTTSVLFLNTIAGEEVNVSLMAVSFGDQVIVNVRQV